VVARVLDEMNLARPKSLTFIIDVAGFLLLYKRFSGYKNIYMERIYLNVSVDNVMTVAILDSVNDGSDSISSFLFRVEFLFKDGIK
jgi:hypothetical protein